MEKEIIYHFLSDDELLRISNKIKAAEKTTAGEICVNIKEKRKFSERNKSLRDLAESEFFKLGIGKTRDKTGILIFILLQDRQFYVLADKGINEKVPEKTWDNIKDEMQENFLEGRFCPGILNAIEKIGKTLAQHFPIKPDDTDEISNIVRFD
jgi:uncharacterized membrane protein